MRRSREPRREEELLESRSRDLGLSDSEQYRNFSSHSALGGLFQAQYSLTVQFPHHLEQVAVL